MRPDSSVTRIYCTIALLFLSLRDTLACAGATALTLTAAQRAEPDLRAEEYEQSDNEDSCRLAGKARIHKRN